jgi:tRNA-modifying protein YgfZ
VSDGQERIEAPEAELTALDEGRAFTHRCGHRVVRIGGSDAEAWLNDLLTAALAGLPPGRARRSLLLGPTGRIRADTLVVAEAGGFLLLQDRRQPASLADLLAPYVLSSVVTLTDVTEDLALYAVPDAGGESRPWHLSRPPILRQGEHLLVRTADAARTEDTLADAGLVRVGEAALEVRRIRRGLPRFPVDLTEDSVPAEAALDDLIDVTKGCFLGQESVAKIRNLGHPTHVIRSLVTEADVGPGTQILAADELVGHVTSAAPGGVGGSACLARVRWAAAGAALSTADGVPLAATDRSA